MKTMRTRNRQDARRQMTLAVVSAIALAIANGSELKPGRTQGGGVDWPAGPPAFIPRFLGSMDPLKVSGAAPCAATTRARRQQVLIAADQATAAQIAALERYRAAVPVQEAGTSTATYAVRPRVIIETRDGYTLTVSAPGLLIAGTLPAVVWDYLRTETRVPVRLKTYTDGTQRLTWADWTAPEHRERWLAAAAAVELLRVEETAVGHHERPQIINVYRPPSTPRSRHARQQAEPVSAELHCAAGRVISRALKVMSA